MLDSLSAPRKLPWSPSCESESSNWDLFPAYRSDEPLWNEGAAATNKVKAKKSREQCRGFFREGTCQGTSGGQKDGRGLNPSHGLKFAPHEYRQVMTSPTLGVRVISTKPGSPSKESGVVASTNKLAAPCDVRSRTSVDGRLISLQSPVAAALMVEPTGGGLL